MELPPQYRNPVRKIRSLAIAQANFNSASRLAHYIIDSEIYKDVELYGAMFSGVAVTYWKNFNESNKVGTFGRDEDFTVFSDSNLQKTHDLLKESRNSIYAHQDAEKISGIDDSESVDLKPFEVLARITETGVSFMPCLSANYPSFCYRVIDLCEVQKDTTKKRINTELNKIVDDPTIYKPGEELVLGKTFPRFEH